MLVAHGMLILYMYFGIGDFGSLVSPYNSSPHFVGFLVLISQTHCWFFMELMG